MLFTIRICILFRSGKILGPDDLLSTFHSWEMQLFQDQYAFDVDGNKYIDYVGTWGPAICGHANEEVISPQVYVFAPPRT